MSSGSKSSIKHIAELISQNKSLEEENIKLQRQVERLSLEVDKYKSLIARYNIQNKEIKAKLPHSKNILKYKLASVLYADAHGFHRLSEAMNTNRLVDNLDEIFIELNAIAERNEIKSLRSIGDSIMCAGGIPQKNTTNPIEVVLAAIKMRYYVNELQRTHGEKRIWNLRFGIHTGPLTVTITGRKKINYEVKGESANLAARICSFCEEGEILVSEYTYELIKDIFICEYFTRMPVKYKGDMLLYYVKKIKPEYSLQKKGLIPNRKFSVRFGLIQFTDLQELMLNKLENELPDYLYYHNVKHTIDVVTQAELIGIGEGVDDESLLLLKTAALFHDSGHILQYDDHEHYGTIIAREILPDFYYTQKQIDIICDLIMVTKMPPEPKNKLEKIMCDADLDYLGRSDMIPVSNTLFSELKAINKVDSIIEWNKLQMEFISNHSYFTETAQSLREVNKQKQIARIKDLIDKG